MTICRYQVFSGELTHGSLSEASVSVSGEWTVRPSSSDIRGLLHLDQIWFLLHPKHHFQFYFVLVLELLSQAFLNQLTSPLLLKQEDGVFSLPILE